MSFKINSSSSSLTEISLFAVSLFLFPICGSSNDLKKAETKRVIKDKRADPILIQSWSVKISAIMPADVNDAAPIFSFSRQAYWAS